MALIKCPECKKEISDTADKCINCGYVLKSNKNKMIEFIKNKKKLLIILGIVIAIIIIIYNFGFSGFKNRNKIVKYLEKQGYNCVSEDFETKVCTNSSNRIITRYKITSSGSTFNVYYSKNYQNRYIINIDSCAYYSETCFIHYANVTYDDDMMDTFVASDGTSKRIKVGEHITINRTDIYDDEINSSLREIEDVYRNTGNISSLTRDACSVCR